MSTGFLSLLKSRARFSAPVAQPVAQTAINDGSAAWEQRETAKLQASVAKLKKKEVASKLDFFGQGVATAAESSSSSDDDVDDLDDETDDDDGAAGSSKRSRGTTDGTKKEDASVTVPARSLSIKELQSKYDIHITGSDVPPLADTFAVMQKRLNVPSLFFKNLSAPVANGGFGFRAPTPIQMQAVPAILARREVLALAPTGSGKTVAYLLPLLAIVAQAPKYHELDGTHWLEGERGSVEGASDDDDDDGDDSDAGVATSKKGKGDAKSAPTSTSASASASASAASAATDASPAASSGPEGEMSWSKRMRLQRKAAAREARGSRAAPGSAAAPTDPAARRCFVTGKGTVVARGPRSVLPFRGVVLAPTRELAYQISRVASGLVRGSENPWRVVVLNDQIDKVIRKAAVAHALEVRERMALVVEKVVAEAEQQQQQKQQQQQQQKEEVKDKKAKSDKKDTTEKKEGKSDTKPAMDVKTTTPAVSLSAGTIIPKDKTTGKLIIAARFGSSTYASASSAVVTAAAAAVEAALARKGAVIPHVLDFVEFADEDTQQEQDDGAATDNSDDDDGEGDKDEGSDKESEGEEESDADKSKAKKASSSSASSSVNAGIVIAPRRLLSAIHPGTESLPPAASAAAAAAAAPTSHTPRPAPVVADAACQQIVVSTPLRLLRLLTDTHSELALARVVVFDEADQLFNLGFLEQMDLILRRCTNPRAVRVLCSATVTAGVESLARNSLRDPIRIVVGGRNVAQALVTQRLVYVGNQDGKDVELKRMISEGLNVPMLIFVQSKERAMQLYDELKLYPIRAQAIHADKSAGERQSIIDAFRRGKIWVLICTDLLSRGIDFKHVNCVVNYDFPQSTTSYIHRIGRTGRVGRPGEAVTFVAEEDRTLLRHIAHIVHDSTVAQSVGRYGMGGEYDSHIPQWMLELPRASAAAIKRLAEKAPVREAINRTNVAERRAEKDRKRAQSAWKAKTGNEQHLVQSRGESGSIKKAFGEKKVLSKTQLMKHRKKLIARSKAAHRKEDDD